MLSAIKSEFRKLLTVRSTYFITLLVLFLIGLIGFYINGWNLHPMVSQAPDLLVSDATDAVLILAAFGAIVAILLMTHEYRYNTITYTLTACNSRSKVLIAKLIAVSAYAVFLTALIAVLSPLSSYLGITLHGHDIGPQHWQWGTLIWHTLFYGWAYGVAGLLLAVLVRSQVGAIAALFLIPGVIEQLLMRLLKEKSIYLPFTALHSVINFDPKISDIKSAVVFGAYLVVGWIIAWILFLKRDAN